MKKISRRAAIRRLSGVMGSAMFLGNCGNAFGAEQQNQDNTGGIEAELREYHQNRILFSSQKPVVSISRIPPKKDRKNGIEYAVREAIDLLGGMKSLTRGKERILLKPNLVSPAPSDTTKPEVIEALVKLMQETGKDVSIGEGSAASSRNIRFTVKGYVCRTKKNDVLQGIQNDVFENLGYNALARTMKVPLVNLHVGDMVKFRIPDNFVFGEIVVHDALNSADLVCSVPMMKTHGLAGVTLGMKNFIGAYPGQVYGTVRSVVHQTASEVEPSGTASAIIDMIKATRFGLTVIDATTAMEGQGPSKNGGGRLLDMNLIIAGTNALATDMVGAYVMGFQPDEISTFEWAWKAGMKPSSMDDIEVRGQRLNDVKHNFIRPYVVPYTQLKSWYGPPC